jgi:hypothetical protein
MTRIHLGIAGAAVIALIAACAHESSMHSQTAGGELAFDSMRAAPAESFLLRVQNDYGAPVRVFAEANEDTSLVVNVAPGASQTVALGPDYFRYALTTFEIRPTNDSASTLIGPLSLNRGDRVRIVVAPNLDSSHVYQNGNW